MNVIIIEWQPVATGAWPENQAATITPQPYSKVTHMKQRKINTGDVFLTNEGGSVTVIDYRRYSNILIEHNDENLYRAWVQGGALRNGQVKNPYHKHAYGVGFLGDGRFRSCVNGTKTPAYALWKGMLKRAYCKEFLKLNPTYSGVTVCNEWLNFQTFSNWFYSEPNSNSAGFQMDKDLRVFGNKEYSPRACSFVPYQINYLLNDCMASRGRLPQGVRARGSRFQPALAVNGKIINLSLCETPGQAYRLYKSAKESNVRRMANEWKASLHPEVYEFLSEWFLEPEKAR